MIENSMEVRYYETVIQLLASSGKKIEDYLKKYTFALFPWEEGEKENTEGLLSANEMADMYKKMINK